MAALVVVGHLQDEEILEDVAIVTGIALVDGSQEWTEVETTRVEVAPLTPAEIDWYVATGEPMDKAGAYGIQGYASRFIERIEGSYANVVGLPVHRVYRLLSELPPETHR